VAARHFTPEEANELLAEVRPLAEEMVRRRAALVAARGRRSEIAATIGGNGGGLPRQELTALAETIEEESQALAGCVARIQELGVLVKDLDAGLVDFPALREGEEVLLCWRVGEDEIRYWHGLDEGFAGRKELPL
jgi:hypothetical protein